MGQIENTPRHEALPSNRDIFPLGIGPINQAVLALRNTPDPNEFVFQEREHTGFPFYTYLERYYTKFEKSTEHLRVDKLSFFVGAMLTHRMIREQVSQLNSDLATTLKRAPSQDETIELPRFENPEGLFNNEMSALNYWKAETGRLDWDISKVATNRIIELADPAKNESKDLDTNVGSVLFYVSALAPDAPSFYAGAGATYFAVKNAITENQEFEELLKPSFLP